MIKNTEKNAIIYCEGQFGSGDGKTAVGLIRHSENYNIVGVLDSQLSGKDSGEELGIEKNNIPIFSHLEEALEVLGHVPKYCIYGKAPMDTQLSTKERSFVIEAIKKGMSVVNGLHQIFSNDLEFSRLAKENDIEIIDVRKVPELNNLHLFSGDISEVDVPIVAILGTDCASGKMTTARELNEALNGNNIKSVLIATGQTMLMQGAKYGIAIDAVPSQFVIGEIENSIIEAFRNESPQIILIEGQSSLSHEAFMSSTAILKASEPDAIILQHPPGREYRVDFPQFEMPSIDTEVDLIGAVSEAKILAITLSHEGLDTNELHEFIDSYEAQFDVPVVDVLTQGCQKIIDTLIDYFPELNEGEENEDTTSLF